MGLPLLALPPETAPVGGSEHAVQRTPPVVTPNEVCGATDRGGSEIGILARQLTEHSRCFITTHCLHGCH